MVLEGVARSGPARVLAVVTLAASCGAPAPTTPQPPIGPNFPAGTVFTVRSGEDERAVPGAMVRIVGHGDSGATIEMLLQTNSAGQVVSDRAIAYDPVPEVDITAEGFLKRETAVRQPEQRIFTLWPSASSSGLDEHFSALIVYSTSRCPAQVDLRTLQRHNPLTSQVNVVLDSPLQEPQDQTLHQKALDALNTASGSRPRYVLSDALVDGQVSVFIRADPAYGACPSGNFGAYTIVSGVDRNITGAQINYCSLGAARNPAVIAHELGHSFGLNHADGAFPDVMACSAANSDFSPREILAIRLLLQRPGGNAWPDRDRPVQSLSTAALGQAPTQTAFACPRPAR